MGTPESRVIELGRASRRAAMLSALGAIVFVSSLLFSWYRWNVIDKQVSEKRQELQNLTDSIDRLSKLNYLQISPNNKVFQMRAVATSLHKNNEEGQPLYLFTVYVQATDDVMPQIKSVHYRLDHPTFQQPDQEGSPEPPFSMKYTGWGCLTKLKVTIFWKGGTQQQFPFDMCQSLGDWKP